MQALEGLAPGVGTAPACVALGIPRATVYRRRSPRAGSRPRPKPARALSLAERDEVLAVLHAERFVDKAPAEVYATLLDENTYLCATRTMYRILGEMQEVRERRNQLRHPNYVKPQLLATAPAQVWSWDISKLHGPAKLTYFYLHVILDIFSRYVVGWMVAGAGGADEDRARDLVNAIQLASPMPRVSPRALWGSSLGAVNPPGSATVRQDRQAAVAGQGSPTRAGA
jgi:putative transposase